MASNSNKAQTGETIEVDQTQTNQEKLEEMMFKQGVEYQKFAENKATKFANELDEQTLPADYKKELEDKKNAEIKRKADEQKAKEDEIRR